MLQGSQLQALKTPSLFFIAQMLGEVQSNVCKQLQSSEKSCVLPTLILSKP